MDRLVVVGVAVHELVLNMHSQLLEFVVLVTVGIAFESFICFHSQTLGRSFPFHNIIIYKH